MPNDASRSVKQSRQGAEQDFRHRGEVHSKRRTFSDVLHPTVLSDEGLACGDQDQERHEQSRNYFTGMAGRFDSTS